jgi:hypothetical protein
VWGRGDNNRVVGGSLGVDNYSVRLDQLPGIFISLYVYLLPRDPLSLDHFCFEHRAIRPPPTLDSRTKQPLSSSAPTNMYYDLFLPFPTPDAPTKKKGKGKGKAPEPEARPTDCWAGLSGVERDRGVALSGHRGYTPTLQYPNTSRVHCRCAHHHGRAEQQRPSLPLRHPRGAPTPLPRPRPAHGCRAVPTVAGPGHALPHAPRRRQGAPHRELPC